MKNKRLELSDFIQERGERLEKYGGERGIHRSIPSKQQ